MTREEQRIVATTRLNYPPGTRLELISMEKDPDPVPPGTRGTVERVNSYGDIEMSWDMCCTRDPKVGTLVFFASCLNIWGILQKEQKSGKTATEKEKSPYRLQGCNSEGREETVY